MLRLLVLVCAGLALAGTPSLPADEPIAVIVHPERTDTISREELVRIYRRQRRFWNDGTSIVPLNLEAGTPVRERFSTLVLHADSAALAAYWNQQYFQGVLPPPVLSSSEAVKRYVAADRKAVGYVAASVVDRSVRVVLTLD